ncbi:MAG TPA: ABC transporter ATP-binding protein [Acidimicrobiales bacterium]|nr:ABC transporter ATP-binding protein [Acidimicrobiales bacterium]
MGAFASSRLDPEAPVRAPSAAGEDGDAIRTQGLTKVHRGGVVAVDGLDLSVRPGEIFGLLGPNGAGKTTTVGMLTTRILPTAGRALVGGVDVVAQPARARQVFGVVSQANTLDRSLTVWENLYFHGRYAGMSAAAARQAAHRWLEAFRLAHRAKAEVGELSGGMARRLMLARAMLHGPGVVFLDEPTAGLDPQSRLALWDIIGDLHAAGQTVLLTTHYMEEAEQFCQRVAIMDHGRVLALDTPAGLKRSLDASVSVTVKAEGHGDGLARHLATIDGATGAHSLDDGSVALHLDTGEGALGRVIAAAERGGFRLTDVAVSEANLETVFISLTGRELRE